MDPKLLRCVRALMSLVLILTLIGSVAPPHIAASVVAPSAGGTADAASQATLAAESTVVTLSATGGYVGDVIGFTLQSEIADEVIELFLFDPISASSQFLLTVAADASGFAESTFTVPDVAPESYEVHANGEINTGRANFIVQQLPPIYDLTLTAWFENEAGESITSSATSQVVTFNFEAANSGNTALTNLAFEISAPIGQSGALEASLDAGLSATREFAFSTFSPGGYDVAITVTVTATELANPVQATMILTVEADPEPTPSQPAEPDYGFLIIRAEDAATGAAATFCVDILISGENQYYCSQGSFPPTVTLSDIPVGDYSFTVMSPQGHEFDAVLVENVAVGAAVPVTVDVEVVSNLDDLGVVVGSSFGFENGEPVQPEDPGTLYLTYTLGAFEVGDINVSVTIGLDDPTTCFIPSPSALTEATCSVQFQVRPEYVGTTVLIEAVATSALLTEGVALSTQFDVPAPVSARLRAVDSLVELIPGACFQLWDSNFTLMADECAATGELLVENLPPGDFELYVTTPPLFEGFSHSFTLADGSGESVIEVVAPQSVTAGLLDARLDLWGAPDSEIGAEIEAVFVAQYLGFTPLRNVVIAWTSEVLSTSCPISALINTGLCYWRWTPTASDAGRSFTVTGALTADGLAEPVVLSFLVRVQGSDDNTPVGTDVHVPAFGWADAYLTFELVDVAGRTSYTRNYNTAGMPFDPPHLADGAMIFDLVTTAEFTGSFELCQPYSRWYFTDARLLWWSGTAWVEIGAEVTDGTGEQGTVCGVSSATGIFALVDASSATPPNANVTEVTVLAGESLSIDVLANVIDEDTDPAELTVAIDPSTLPAYGTVEIDPEDSQRVLFTASTGTMAFDQFAVLVSDGVHTISAWVYVTIEGPHALHIELTDPTGYGPPIVCVSLVQVLEDSEVPIPELCTTIGEPQEVTFSGLVPGTYQYSINSSIDENAFHGSGSVTIGDLPLATISAPIEIDPAFGWLIVRSTNGDGSQVVTGACWLLALEDGNYQRCTNLDDPNGAGIAAYYRVPPGEYELFPADFGAPGGYAPASARMVTITAGQVTVVDVPHQAAEVLEIVAIDSLNQIVPGFCVRTYDQDST